MQPLHHSIVHVLVSEEIERIISEASKDGGLVRAGQMARLLTQTYPNSGFEHGDLVDQIIAAAARAGVAVEMSQSI